VTGSLRLRQDHISWAETDTEVVILNLETAKYLVINAAGRVLWKQLCIGTTHEQMERLLRHSFGLDARSAGADVADFVLELDSYGLLIGLNVEPNNV
jgi:Coenzyme PQQ synthesis protein D (PqqD)